MVIFDFSIVFYGFKDKKKTIKQLVTIKLEMSKMNSRPFIITLFNLFAIAHITPNPNPNLNPLKIINFIRNSVSNIIRVTKISIILEFR